MSDTPEATREAEPAAQTAQLARTLRSADEPLWCVADAARDPRVLALLRQHGGRFQTLYEGLTATLSGEYGPFLCEIPHRGPLLAELLAQGWGNCWAIYLHARCDFAKLRRHLRKYVLVELPGRRQAFFRFFDPVVLRMFLPTCTDDEYVRFFGPITRFLAEAEDPAELIEFLPGHREPNLLSVPR